MRRAGRRQRGKRHPLQVSLYIKHYNASDELTAVHGEFVSVAPGQDAVIAWRVPDAA